MCDRTESDKMQIETKEIINLTARELLGLIDGAFAYYELIFAGDKSKRFSLHRYLEENAANRSGFLEKVSYLRRRGLVRRITEGKKSYIEITQKGREHIRKMEFDDLSVTRPEVWDKKWRVVISDIPEKERVLRNVMRAKLYQIGFLQVQKSVFVFPFECTREVNLICDNLGGRKYIKYLIADIIEGETEIIEQFLDSGILTKQILNIQQ